MRPILIAILAAAAPLAACGHDDHGHDPDEEACVHLGGGPYQAIAASETRDSSAPAIAADHRAYRVTLPAGGPGFVYFAAPDAGDYLFYLSEPVTAAFTDSSGAAVIPEDSATSSPACATIRGRHLVPLEVGTYFLELSSGTVDVVDVVVEAAGGDHDH